MYKEEKMTEKEKKKKISIETEVPDPPVPNRAWTEMSTKESLGDKLKHDIKRTK